MNSTIQENIKQVKDLTKEQLEAIYFISDKLNKSKYRESLIEEALDWVIGVVNAERGLFVRLNEESRFDIISARHVNQESITDMSEFSSGILQNVMEEKNSVLYHDAMSDPHISKFQSIQINQIKSIIGVPIFREEEIWGVIAVDSTKDRSEFTEENLIFLNFFSNLVSLALDKIMSVEKLEDEKEKLKNQIDNIAPIPKMIGESTPMKNLSRLIRKVADTDATVLILGESGTGKDLVAQAVHKLSRRDANPYLAQFCGSIPDNLLESELFGYKKGAFTGATTDKKGLLEVANGGTFFLDEIADISSALQAKLLRVLENKEIMRLGDTHVKKVDVRIVAATNKDLKKLVKEGTFREDLFYRLNVFPVMLPPLRERKGDIVLLADFFVKNMTEDKKTIDMAAIKKLEKYNWPGNVRQLSNVMQRAVILADGNKIGAEHIIWDDDESECDFEGTLKEMEKTILKKRLERFDGNRTAAAESLGVSVRWVQMKLKEMQAE